MGSLRIAHVRRVMACVVLIAALAATGISCRQTAETRTAVSAEVHDPRESLTRFITMLERRDPALIDEFADDPDVVVVGSEASEIAIGREQIAQLLKVRASGPSVKFEWTQTRSASNGDVAWLFASGDAVITDNGRQTRLPYRLTGVLERRNGAWKWRQFHGSAPAMR